MLVAAVPEGVITGSPGADKALRADLRELVDSLVDEKEVPPDQRPLQELR